MQGQAAAIFAGVEFAVAIKASAGPQVTVLPAPGFGPRRANLSTRCRGLAVTGGGSAASRPKVARDAAWALVEWLALGDPARERFSAGQGLPADRALVDFSRGGALEKLVQRELDETRALCIQTSSALDFAALSAAWSKQEERYLAGQVGLDEMLANVEDEGDLALRALVDSAGGAK